MYNKVGVIVVVGVAATGATVKLVVVLWVEIEFNSKILRNISISTHINKRYLKYTRIVC